MPRILLISLAAVIAAACSVAAQEASPPPDVRFDRVRMGKDSMQIYLVRGGQPLHVGMLWDSLQVAEHAGVPAMRREY
ncbi:MAG TPA: hypothetical protein VGC13_20300 [Longimicrobium sp.]|jgi:hypothetical protein|uniref:hypothetical protein n=1 Tax=Longimicrobium sp. TaxID=2029185 RepID=UPI002ED8C947